MPTPDTSFLAPYVVADDADLPLKQRLRLVADRIHEDLQSTMPKHSPNILQAIGPTNFRGSRIAATTGSGMRMTVECDDALNMEENHAAAAQALAKKYGWTGPWHGGATTEGYCFVRGANNAFEVV